MLLLVPTSEESKQLLSEYDGAPALQGTELPCAWIHRNEDDLVTVHFDPCRINSPRAQVRVARDTLHRVDDVASARVCVDLRALTTRELWRLRRTTTEHERRAGVAVWVNLPYRVEHVDVLLASAFARSFARGVIAACLSAKMQARVHVS